MGTLANRYGESSSTSTFQQKSKFFLGEHVSMVSLQWKLLTTGGYHKVRTAMFVVVKLKAQTMPFSAAISHPWFGVISNYDGGKMVKMKDVQKSKLLIEKKE